MEMEIQSGVIESVTKSDILGLQLATWERERSPEELRERVTRRLAELAFVEEDL